MAPDRVYLPRSKLAKDQTAMQRMPLSVVFAAFVIGGLFIIHDWQTAVGIIALLVVSVGALAITGLIFATSLFLGLLG